MRTGTAAGPQQSVKSVIVLLFAPIQAPRQEALRRLGVHDGVLVPRVGRAGKCPESGLFTWQFRPLE